MHDNLEKCFGELGSNFRGHVMVLECDLRQTKASKSFITMRVTDGNKAVDCVRWGSDAEFNPGNVVLLIGASGMYQGAEQFTIKGCAYAPEEDRSKYAIKLSTTSFTECREFIVDIVDEHLSQVLLDYFDTNRDELLLAAGAAKMHHNYAGGYLDHIVEVVRYAVTILGESKHDIYKQVNKDVLIASAIMHDDGKLKAYDVDSLTGIVTKGHEGYYTDHIIDTCCTLRKIIGDYKHYDQIEHCIISHHGNLEWGALKQPSSLEAYILHTADMLSSQLESMSLAFKQEPNKFGWTKGKVFPFNRPIFIGNKSPS